MTERRKPREFWIGIDENDFPRWLSCHENFAFISTEGCQCKENLKVREVMPDESDWKKMCEEMKDVLLLSRSGSSWEIVDAILAKYEVMKKKEEK